MNRLLFIFLVFSYFSAKSQTGYLFVKRGIHKKKTYTEGTYINLLLNDGTTRNGMITRLMNDTIYISGRPVPRLSVEQVVLPRKKKSFHIDAKELLLITGGVALTTAGLTLSKQATFGEAVKAGTIIGYSPLLIGYAGSKISFRRKRYRIGKKFRLQVLDFYLPRRRAF